MLLLALFACVDTKPPVETVESLACAAGEIRVASTGAAYPTLGTALDGAAEVDTICIGAGTWLLEDTMRCSGDSLDMRGRTLTVVGAGADKTTLVGAGGVGPGNYCHDLGIDTFEAAQSWSGVTFWNAAVTLEGSAVAVSDVRVSHYSGDMRALRLISPALDIRGLTLADNVFDYGAGFELRGDGTLADLVLERTRSDGGNVGEIYGNVAWTGGRVSENTRTIDEQGFDLIETWGDVRVNSVTFTDNVTNGPILTAHDALTLTDVEFLANQTDWRGVLTSHGHVTMTGGALRGNEGLDGAIAIFEGGEIELVGVDVEDNVGCAVTGDGACLREDLGPDTTVSCDAGGCG
ncbi:MAG: hypothetical protein V4850_27050 [Myxococcota bacterium]